MTDSPRIISLLPSATEIVAALGFGDHLVGRSHECDFPPGVEKLPACSSTKVPVEGSSSEIDERVKEIVAEGLSVYRVDVERLRELRPDLILTQTQCAVCAVTPRDLETFRPAIIGQLAFINVVALAGMIVLNEIVAAFLAPWLGRMPRLARSS